MSHLHARDGSELMEETGESSPPMFDNTCLLSVGVRVLGLTILFFVFKYMAEVAINP